MGSQPNAPLLILSHSLLVKLKDYTICHILLRRKHLNVTQVISRLWSLALPFMYWYFNPHSWDMAENIGFEPITLRLTAVCSTIELPRNIRLKEVPVFTLAYFIRLLSFYFNHQ